MYRNAESLTPGWWWPAAKKCCVCAFSPSVTHACALGSRADARSTLHFSAVVQERFIHAAHSWATSSRGNKTSIPRTIQRNVSTCRALWDNVDMDVSSGKGRLLPLRPMNGPMARGTNERRKREEEDCAWCIITMSWHNQKPAAATQLVMILLQRIVDTELECVGYPAISCKTI